MKSFLNRNYLYQLNGWLAGVTVCILAASLILFIYKAGFANQLSFGGSNFQLYLLIFTLSVTMLGLGFLAAFLHLRRQTKNIIAEKTNLIKQQALAEFSTLERLKKREEELNNLNATKDKFFSIIAHDLKNPFNSLLGFSDLLVNDFDQYKEEEIKRFIQIIHDSSRQGFNLLDNLLQWSRSQSGHISFVPDAIFLKEVVLGSINLLQTTADQKKIKIYHDLPDDLVINGDIEMLSTVFRNLISNAIKFTPSNGRVKIKSRLLVRQVEISVVDTGVGIPEDKIKDLFRIDRQVSTPGTSNEKGTGLGLILCKEFIDKHGGRIKVTSERKNGSEFKVYLPLKTKTLRGRDKKQKRLIEAG